MNRPTVPQLVAAYERKHQTSFFTNKPMNKPTLSQLLAAFQLAEMAHQADQSDYKRQVRDQAETEYKQALQESDLEPIATATDQPKKTDVEILQAIVDELDQAYQIKVSDVDKLATRCARLEDEKKALADECKQLYADKMALVKVNLFLTNQLNEKEPKKDELEKSPLSATPATVETATVETATVVAATVESAPAAPAPAAAPQPARVKPLTGAAKAAVEAAAAKAAAAATEPAADETKKNS